MKKLNCILLIDDNHLTNIIDKKVIEKSNIAEYIQAVESGKEGLEYIAQQSTTTADDSEKCPSLIFLDINMPVMNGWEFLKECEKLCVNQNRKIPIVMLTTSPNPDDEKKAREHEGVIDFKRKPLTKEMISEIFERNFLQQA